MRVWLRGKWLKIRVSVIALIAFIAGVANTYAYVQYQELSGSLSENRGSTFIQINAEPVSARSDVEPVAEAEDESPQLSVQEIAQKIMQLESSGGLNNYSKCEAVGKFNRYGYGIPGDGSYKCFENKEQEDETITNWFSEKLLKYDLNTAVCGYNLGFKSSHLNDCLSLSDEYPYLKRFLTL